MKIKKKIHFSPTDYQSDIAAEKTYSWSYLALAPWSYLYAWIVIFIDYMHIGQNNLNCKPIKHSRSIIAKEKRKTLLILRL